MEYRTPKTFGKSLAAMAAFAFFGGSAFAEHASGSALAGFHSSFPAGAASVAPRALIDNRALTLPGVAKRPSVLPPPVDGNPNDRIAGYSLNSHSFLPTPKALAGPFATGYRAPQRAAAPVAFVPYARRIGLSRVPVPQGALPTSLSSAVQ